MKRLLLVLVIICLAGGALAAQESKTGSIGLMFTDSIAFAGLYGELMLGNIGLGLTFTALPLGGGDAVLIFYEPGAYGRLYLGDPSSAMYLTGGMTYFTVAGGSSDTNGLQGFDGGILNVNGGVGYNAFLGNNESTRFSIEIGPRYSTFVVQGEDAGVYEGFFLHFALYFGALF